MKDRIKELNTLDEQDSLSMPRKGEIRASSSTEPLSIEVSVLKTFLTGDQSKSCRIFLDSEFFINEIALLGLIFKIGQSSRFLSS